MKKTIEFARLRQGAGTLKRQAGVTMIEVLIALAVLSIGLAGMAGMQLSSMQFVHSAHYRSLASSIALDFEERLWLEIADDTLAGCPSTGTGEGSPAADLLSDWARSAVGESDALSNAHMLKIPNVSMAVGTPVTGPSVTLIPITIGWNEDRFSDNESTAESFTYNIRILCRPAA